MAKYHQKCPNCGSQNTKKRGKENNRQTYSCNECRRRFRRDRRSDRHEAIWHDYVFKKQTIREICDDAGYDRKTVKRYLNEIEVPVKTHTPRAINLVVDATYFGKRTDGSAWGVLLFRDSKQKENLWWKYIDTERESHYREGREYLEKLGYTILSVTCDGFAGNLRVFRDVPLQMCHFHMKQIIIRNISTKPKTEAGQVLLAISQTLTYTDKETLRSRIQQFYAVYGNFLLERTIHPDGSWSYTHAGVRSAATALTNWFDHLFVYLTDSSIPNTTNTCDGHFSHVKDIVRIHRGLKMNMKQKVLDAIFLESTIAPRKKRK